MRKTRRFTSLLFCLETIKNNTKKYLKNIKKVLTNKNKDGTI